MSWVRRIIRRHSEYIIQNTQKNCAKKNKKRRQIKRKREKIEGVRKRRRDMRKKTEMRERKGSWDT